MPLMFEGPWQNTYRIRRDAQVNGFSATIWLFDEMSTAADPTASRFPSSRSREAPVRRHHPAVREASIVAATWSPVYEGQTRSGDSI